MENSAINSELCSDVIHKIIHNEDSGWEEDEVDDESQNDNTSVQMKKKG